MVQQGHHQQQQQQQQQQPQLPPELPSLFADTQPRIRSGRFRYVPSNTNTAPDSQSYYHHSSLERVDVQPTSRYDDHQHDDLMGKIPTDIETFHRGNNKKFEDVAPMKPHHVISSADNNRDSTSPDINNNGSKSSSTLYSQYNQNNKKQQHQQQYVRYEEKELRTPDGQQKTIVVLDNYNYDDNDNNRNHNTSYLLEEPFPVICKLEVREARKSITPTTSTQKKQKQSSSQSARYMASKLSWYDMIQKRMWDHWSVALEEYKRNRKHVTDEMVLDIDTSILHVAAWKAPAPLTLLLLDVMTNQTIDGMERTKKFLLCGDTEGNTPLHLACANIHPSKNYQTSFSAVAAVDFSVIKNLLLLAPEALEISNNFGDTPLHLLLSSTAFQRRHDGYAIEAAAEEAIASLLMMAGHLAIAQNNDGCTLLHIAIANQCHERVLMRLLSTGPGAVMITDKRDMLPIHYVAAFGGMSSTFVEQLVDICPNSICSQTIHGDTPLHLLATNAREQIQQNRKGGFSKMIIDPTCPDSRTDHELDSYYQVNRQMTKLAELLLGNGNEETSPLLLQNNDDYTPLHCCAIFDTPVQLTRILMNHSSKGYSVISSVLQTNNGMSALHYAVIAKAKSNQVSNHQEQAAKQKNIEANMIALATPQACAIMDENERNPLMMAVQNKYATSRVIKTLLESLPESVGTTTSNGLLPIHLACQNRKVKLSIVKALVKAYPGAVSARTNRLNTPLHEACKHGVSTDVIDFLILKYPAALHLGNNKGERPIDRAQTHCSKNKKLLTYLNKKMRSVHEQISELSGLSFPM